MPLENGTLVLLSELSRILIKYVHKVIKNYFWYWVLKVILSFMCVFFDYGHWNTCHFIAISCWRGFSLLGPNCGCTAIYRSLKSYHRHGVTNAELKKERSCAYASPYMLYVLYRDNLTFLLLYGNGQWANHCAPSVTIQAVETINYGHMLQV
jgi:hypothetical protein